MNEAEKEKAEKRYRELLLIPFELMTLEQMTEFDNLVDVMKVINKKEKKK